MSQNRRPRVDDDPDPVVRRGGQHHDGCPVGHDLRLRLQRPQPSRLGLGRRPAAGDQSPWPNSRQETCNRIYDQCMQKCLPLCSRLGVPNYIAMGMAGCFALCNGVRTICMSTSDSDSAGPALASELLIGKPINEWL